MAKHNLRGLHIGRQLLPDALRFLRHNLIRDPGVGQDFQLDGRLARDKYRGSYERCAKIIQRYSDRPGIDLTDFYYRLLLSFVIGNSDLHLKNLSLIETEPSWSTSPLW